MLIRSRVGRGIVVADDRDQADHTDLVGPHRHGDQLDDIAVSTRGHQSVEPIQYKGCSRPDEGATDQLSRRSAAVPMTSEDRARCDWGALTGS